MLIYVAIWSHQTTINTSSWTSSGLAPDHRRACNDDVIKCYCPRYWPSVRGIHRSPTDSTHKGQWRGALKFSLICAWTNGWTNNRDAGDLRRHHTHYNVIMMVLATELDIFLESFFAFNYYEKRSVHLKLFFKMTTEVPAITRPFDVYGCSEGVTTLWFSDSTWRHRSGSTLAQAMAWCLTAPNYYLYQCWLIISKTQWHPSEQGQFRKRYPSHQSLKLARKCIQISPLPKT